ncbi:arginyl-tRNA synthetase [Catalinimonas alkaloidigena]|uniref:Arginine--tRNA ligase n=1 Tax=Catalinimonas alkaloidigena TaxID=1075417 RepID=A0A1G9RC96_9BACT|nr:arginine--tRNA ligase [Catalinimonas alkaloidigena]SDM20929.1 arginyl-tRNA synthetase [Catalinimonas alkaloidigena]
MDLELSLKKGLQHGFKDIFNADVAEDQLALQPTRKEFEGTYTFVTFPFGRLTKKNPEETGKLLGEYLKNHVVTVADFNVVKGFLNLSIDASFWQKALCDMVAEPAFGFFPDNGQRVMVEYSSPNTNKPLHLGHLRNNFLGYAVAEILRANGYQVVRANLVNDRGVHICKSMLAYQRFGHGETPESSGLKGDHLIGNYYVRFDQEYRKQVQELVAGGMPEEEAKKKAPLMQDAQAMLQKWEEGDPDVRQLWEKMNGWVYEGFAETYRRMGVTFDQYYKESDTYLLGKDIIQEGLEKGVFFRKDDGSVWIDLTAEGLNEKLLLRKDGTSVYMTQDLGTADLKYKDHAVSKSVYVVGNEQDHHFKVLFAILQKLGRPYAEGLYHLSYGMVDLPSGKMKSREGTVVDADDLITEMEQTAENYTSESGKIEGFSTDEARELYHAIALGALKYFLLRVDPKKRMLFNPAESVDFHGNTGPFIQYTHARISSVLQKATQEGIAAEVSDQYALLPEEQAVIVLLNDFPQKVKLAGELYDPSVIAQYAYDLAKEYNRFYSELSILNDENAAAVSFRLVLSQQVASVLKKALGLLGIEAPERM